MPHRVVGPVSDVNLGVVLAESAVANVAQEIVDVPVSSGPGRRLGAGRCAGRQAGDQIDALDGELAPGEVLPQVHDLQSLFVRWGSRGV